MKTFEELLDALIYEQTPSYQWQEAIDELQAAFEKQIPKRTILWNNQKLLCPNCHRAEYIISEPLWSYCGFCGQAIDRSEE